MIRQPVLTRHESVLADLREAIVTGAIAPGERLLQVELAERLGVSRIPLREALRTLHGEGLVIIEPNRGAICRPLDGKDVADLYAVRAGLETIAARTAARRRADLVSMVEGLSDEADRALARGDLARLIELDRQYHSSLAKASANAHVAHMLDGCWSQIMRAMHYYFLHDPYRGSVWREHLGIALAVASGDEDEAATLVERHITDSRNSILRGLEENAP
jgi:DNA-binding GntR family transcriptional regulator